jgi:hypothetical protein
MGVLLPLLRSKLRRSMPKKPKGPVPTMTGIPMMQALPLRQFKRHRYPEPGFP